MAKPTPTPVPVSKLIQGTGVAKSSLATKGAGASSNLIKGITATPKKTAAPKAEANPWQPVLSFGQSLIDIISTPLYFVEGGIAGAQKGKNPITSAAENSVAWTQGKRPQTGSDILKNAGMSNDFWSSLVADIALDPLTYTPGIVISAPIKALLAGSKFATKAAVASSKGIVSKAAVDAAKVISEAKPLVGVKHTVGGFSQTSKAARNTQLIANRKMQKLTVPAVQVAPGRTTSEALQQMLATSLEAGYKGARMSVQRDILKRDLAKIGKVEKKAAKRGEQIATPLSFRLAQEATTAIDEAAKVVEGAAKSPVTAAVSAEVNAKKLPSSVIPTPDVAPVAKALTPLEASAVMTARTPANIKAMKKSLSSVEKLVKNVKGVSAGGEAIANSIKNVLSKENQDAYSALTKMSPENRAQLETVANPATRVAGTNPIETLRRFASGDRQQKEIVSLLASRNVTASTGETYRIADVLNNAEFSGAYETIDRGLRNDLANSLNNILKATKNADSIEAFNKFQIENIAGEKIAQDIKMTNALHPTKPTNEAAFQKVIAGLGATSEKKYANFTEFISGLKAMDTVDTAVLNKILKAIDPEHQLIKEIEAGIKSPNDAAALRSALIRDGANTIKGTQRSLELMSPETFFEASNIGSKDVAIGTVNGIFDGTLQLDKTASLQTQEAAARRLEELNRVNPAVVKDAAESIGRGYKTQFGAINAHAEAEVGGISQLGEAYVVTRGAVDKPEAVVVGIYNQHLASYTTGSVLGKETFRRARANQIAIETTGAPKEFATSRLDDFIARGGVIDTILLGTWRVRPTHVKIVKALRGGIEDAYHHYVMIADTLSVLRDAKQIELANKLMFPSELARNLAINPTLDSVSYEAVGDVVGEILQAAERGTPFNAEAAIKHLATPAPGKKWSTDFKKLMDEAAPEFVTFIQKQDTIDALKAIHESKLKAEVVDMMKPSQRFADETVLQLVEVMDAMTRKGISSNAQRHQFVLDAVNKIAATSHIFGLSNGEVARATYRSIVQTVLEMTDLGKSKLSTPALEQMKKLASANPALQDTVKDFKEALHTMASWDTTGVGRLPHVSQKMMDDAQRDLTGAMEAYRAHKAKLTTDLSTVAVANWRTKMDELQGFLNSARARADKVGIPTFHWNGNDWVATDAYNHTEALKRATQSRSRYIVTEKGRIDVLKYLTDTAAKRPVYKTHGVKHTEASKKFWEEQSRIRRAKNSKNAAAQAAETTMNLIPEIEKLLPDDELAQVARAEQERIYGILNDGEMQMTQEVNTPFNDFYGASTYEAANAANKRAKVSSMKILGERAQAGFGVDPQIYATLNRADSTYYNAIGAVDVYLKDSVAYFAKNKLTTEDMGRALASAISGNAIDDALKDPVSELARQFKKLYDITTEYAKTRGITPSMLQRAFKIRGLGESIGMPNMDEFANEDSLARLFQLLPFAETPDFLVQAAKSEDDIIKNASTLALEKFNDRKATFLKKSIENSDSMSSIAMLHNVISAIQFAGREMTMADSIINNFNYAAEGLSLAAAKKSGEYVVLKTSALQKAGFSLVHHFPADAAGGNYFHKDVAEQIFALDRAYNYTFGKNMAPWLKNMMGVLSFFKATQTILRPGHLVANSVGDMATNLITGCAPTHFSEGFRLAMKFAGGKIQSDWTKSGAEARFNQLVSGFGGLAGRELKTSEKGTAITLKNKRVILDDQYTIGSMADNNALTNDIQSNDSLAMFDELNRVAATTDAEAAYRKTMLEKLTVGLNKNAVIGAYRTAIKPAGDLVAYMSNGNRAATAVRVMQSKNWSSLDEMWAAVNKEVNTLHPTIQSLSATERKTIRPLFSYYTWLRGAHNAFVKMAMDHTAAMLIPSKVFYNQALANEMGPNSIGNLWGNKQSTPDYLNYSAYGPTQAGPRGAMLYRPSILPLDILDNWNLTYDSTKGIDQNTFNNLVNTGRMFGKNINMVFQPGIEFLTGTDLSTGKPSTVKDLQTFGEKLVGNIGTTSLLKGLGVYTPSNKTATSANPLTDRDRQILLQNFLLGMRVADVNTPANIKNASADTQARWLRMMENLRNK